MNVSRRRILLTFTAISAIVCACIAFDEVDLDGTPIASAKNDGSTVPLFYAKHYNFNAFGIEKLHPFDGNKYKRIHDYLITQKLRVASDFIRPQEITDKQLLTVHTPHYIASLQESKTLARILEISILGRLPSFMLDWRILRPMRLASEGTSAACDAALKTRVAINIGGGYHHAASDQGGGFCVYSDAPIAIKALQTAGKIKSALIVDTDAHQGNGFSEVACSLKNVYVLDFYDESVYPRPKVQESWSVPLRARTDGATYLKKLKEILPQAIEKYRPDLIYYNAGSDVLATDPLASLLLSPEDLIERDNFVVQTALKYKIPIAMALAGGYGSQSAMAQARSIEKILQTVKSCKL